MADVEEVAMPPPQTDEKEEEAGVNQKKMESENESEGEETTENKSEDEDDKIKGEDGEKVEDSANSEEKQVRITSLCVFLNIDLISISKKHDLHIAIIRWRGVRLKPKQPV